MHRNANELGDVKSTTVTADSLSVQREIGYKDDGVVGTLTVENQQDGPVKFRIVQPIPAALTSKEAGFKPEAEPREWGLEPDSLVVADILAGADARTYVFGIVAETTESRPGFTSPVIDAVTPLLSTPAEDTGATGLLSRGASTTENPAATTDIDRLQNDAPEDGTVDEGTGFETDGSGATTRGPATVDQAADDVSTSLSVRLSHLQSRVEDVLAYADALEAFLDDHGTGDEIFDEFTGELESFRTELDETQSALAELQAEQTALAGELSELTSEVETLQADVAELKDMREIMADALST